MRKSPTKRPKIRSLKDFLQEATEKYGNFYTYKNTNYIKNNIEIDIFCQEHSVCFKQLPLKFLRINPMCPECAKIRYEEGKIKTVNKNPHRVTTDIFINRAIKRHGTEIFDYSMTEYTTWPEKVKIRCIEHNIVFEQLPADHVNGFNGCPTCGNRNLKKSVNDFYADPERVKIQVDKRIKTCEEKYGEGITHPMQSTEIFEKCNGYRNNWKDYTLPSGKIIQIQGYENCALDILLKKHTESEIVVVRKEMPKFFFNDVNGTNHRYYPDIFIPKENLIIEVKSTHTYYHYLESNFMKKQAVIDLGYNFKFMILSENGEEYTEQEVLDAKGKRIKRKAA